MSITFKTFLSNSLYNKNVGLQAFLLLDVNINQSTNNVFCINITKKLLFLFNSKPKSNYN